MDKVYIFDTTLRDGDQTPGVSISVADKLIIAKQLEKLGVDCIEAGFPRSSPGNFQAVQNIAREVRGCQIAGLAHANAQAVDVCWEAIKEAESPRIHVFISSSDIHIMHQLAKDRETVLEMARSMVARAAKYCTDVEFSPMDATRSDRAYLYKMLEQCIAAGATVINLPDTVGYTIPSEFYQLVLSIRENVGNSHRVRISVHCHNDLGLAVANSLVAVEAGARQIETCVNGIGERAGNAALEEVVMGLKIRSDLFGVETSIDTRELYPTSKLVSSITGFSVQPNKAIVGENAFRHQSGIHQDGVLRMRETYEIMDAADIGSPFSGGQIVISKVSGRHGLRAKLVELGFVLTDEEFARAFEAFKDRADRERAISEDALADIVAQAKKGRQKVG